VRYPLTTAAPTAAAGVPEQPVNFVDEKHLALPDVREYAGEVEFLLQDGARSLFETHAQLGRDDGRECRLPQAGRPVEQYVVHRLSALLGCLDGNGKVFLELGLAGEIVQPGGAQRGFKLTLAFECGGRSDSHLTHVVPD